MIFFLSFRNKSRLIYFAQDYDESYYENIFMKAIIRTVYFYCLRILKIPAIAVSEELGKLLKDRFKANVTVIPNGVHTDIFYPDKDEEYLRMKGNSKVVLVFARSDYRKGFDIAVKTLTHFRGEIDKGNLLVWAVGEKIEVPFEMRNFGFVPPNKLRKILSCSDVLLYPSRHEGLPLFVLEAMACGCALVTTDAVSITTHNVTSLKCKIDDITGCYTAVKELLNKDFLRTKIVTNGIKEVKNYSLAKSNKMFEERLNVIRERAIKK